MVSNQTNAKELNLKNFTKFELESVKVKVSNKINATANNQKNNVITELKVKEEVENLK